MRWGRYPDESGILSNIQSTHSTDVDCIGDRNIVTSRANGYVDFAIEMGKMLELLRTNRICRKPFLFGNITGIYSKSQLVESGFDNENIFEMLM